MKTILKVIGLLVLILLSILLLKTFLVKSRQIEVAPVQKIPLDDRALTGRFTEALRIRTISHDDPAKLDAAEFSRFHDFLRERFPLVHTHLTLEKVNGYSLLFRWEGSDMSLAPLLMMAHMDVVPVGSGAWKHPPFGGVVAESYIWGRGTLDDKSSLISLLEAIEYLLAHDFTPKQTVYLAFGHDEEAGGRGAAAMAAQLEARGIKPDMVLDEGGAILNAMIPGVVVPTAMIGTSEKGYVTLELSLQESGGHSSAPPKHTAIGILGEAIRRLEANPMPAKLEGSAAHMLDYLGPELPFVSRFFVANRWFFQPLITFGFTTMPVTNATVRTTTAATMIQGGIKENVLPSLVTATINFRIRPGETMDDVVQHVRRTVKNDRIKITKRPHGINPSPVSSVESPQFNVIQRTIRQIYPNVIVIPGIVIGATDARHFTKLSKNVFRFAPFTVTMDDFQGVHGTNERIRADVYPDMVRFYIQFLRNRNE